MIFTAVLLQVDSSVRSFLGGCNWAEEVKVNFLSEGFLLTVKRVLGGQTFSLSDKETEKKKKDNDRRGISA